jgi:hypothetical protein
MVLALFYDGTLDVEAPAAGACEPFRGCTPRAEVGGGLRGRDQR